MSPNSLQPADPCYQGSTDFYDRPATDEFTPSYLVAQALSDNVGTRKDGTTPPWMKLGRETVSPTQQYVEWFNGIWQTGDPSTWGPDVFTNDAVMIDPTGITHGAKPSAANFIRLFDYYPSLRGEVVSWAANDREIFINWRFQISEGDDGDPILVAVIDKFCFVDGRVSFRLAYFDLMSLASYLSARFGQDQLLDYLGASFRSAESTGGIQTMPRMIWNAVSGCFRWLSSPTPSGLAAQAGSKSVQLSWPPIEGASYYKVCRGDSMAGPYNPISDQVPNGPGPFLHFEDQQVASGKSYWYIVTPFFGSWHPVPVKSHLPAQPLHTSS